MLTLGPTAQSEAQSASYFLLHGSCISGERARYNCKGWVEAQISSEFAQHQQQVNPAMDNSKN